MIVHGEWLKISEQNDIRGFKPKNHSNFKRLLNTTATYLCNFLCEIYSPNFVRFDLKNHLEIRLPQRVFGVQLPEHRKLNVDCK